MFDHTQKQRNDRKRADNNSEYIDGDAYQSPDQTNPEADPDTIKVADGQPFR